MLLLTYTRLLCFLAESILSGALRVYHEAQVSKAVWRFSPWASLDQSQLVGLGTSSHSPLLEPLRTVITKIMALERKAAHNKAYAQTPGGKASKATTERKRGAEPVKRAAKRDYLSEHREIPDVKEREGEKRQARRATVEGKAKRAKQKRDARARKKAAA